MSDLVLLGEDRWLFWTVVAVLLLLLLWDFLSSCLVWSWSPSMCHLYLFGCFCRWAFFFVFFYMMGEVTVNHCYTTVLLLLILICQKLCWLIFWNGWSDGVRSNKLISLRPQWLLIRMCAIVDVLCGQKLMWFLCTESPVSVLCNVQHVFWHWNIFSCMGFFFCLVLSYLFEEIIR